jgi:serine/threonine-protein kinase
MGDQSASGGGDPTDPTIVRRRGSGRPQRSSSEPAAPDTLVDGAHEPGAATDTPDTSQTIQDRTVADALFAEEVTRARGFSAVAMFMIALVGLQAPWLPGDPTAKAIAGVALALMFVTSAWSFVRAWRPGGYTKTVFRIHGWVLATLIVPVEYYIGFYSPVTVTLSLGIYYLGQSTDRVHAFWLPLYVAASWIGGALLITVGVIRDRAFFATHAMNTYTQVFMIIGVGCTLLTTMWMARVARRSVRDAIVASNRALLEAQKQQALLAEAHHHLDRAVRAAIGKPGRHTGGIAGNYRIGTVIGVGAMGEVYAADSLDGSRSAAVKLLHPDALVREDNVVRFLREAAVCLRLDHPNLVKVHEVGRTDSGAPFMAMERLQGESLASILREHGQLPLGTVVALARAIAAGLMHAHDNGVIHRDLKPHNIFEHRDDGGTRWTILDFGISKLADSTGTLTRESLVGTPAYMSPEQALGQDVDHRSDLFAFASVLYRALTGQPAFPGRDAPRIMFDVAYRMPQRPSAHDPGIPGDVDLVFAIALAKERKLRFESADAFVRALEAARTAALDEGLRARAKVVLYEHPWGP